MKTGILSRKTPVIIKDGYDFADPNAVLRDVALPGECYAFQIAVLSDAEYEGTKELRLACGGMAGNFTVARESIFCINFGGINWHGEAFTKHLALASGEQQILWVTVPVPEEASGAAEGSFTVSLGDETAELTLYLTAEGEKAERGGEDRPWDMTRLGWLNSTRALSGGPTGVYPALKREENRLDILGRSLYIGSDGLPQEGYSLFDRNLHVSGTARKVFGKADFRIRTADGETVNLVARGTEFEPEDGEGITYRACSVGDCFRLEVEGRSEFDGWNLYKICLSSDEDRDIEDISIRLPFQPGFETYMMGLGRKGGYRPSSYDFKWDAAKHQNPVFIGGLNGGARVEFMGEDFVEPFVNIYYRHRPYHLSKAFYNEGKGGITIESEPDGGALLRAYSGARHMEKGESLCFDFSLLITPLKEFDTKKRFKTWYDHSWFAKDCVREAREVGANTIIIHHASVPNPYINYPFLENRRLRALSDEIHGAGMKMKIYYTVRELSDRACEMQAFRSLGDEIYPRPRGGMGSILWQPETLEEFRREFGDDVIPAWKSDMDSALLSDTASRLCNYYIEGLDYLVRKIDIDGLYIDDTGYDRITMRRARRVLDQKEGCLVDLHSWNHADERAGRGNSLNIYMPLLPYIDSLWIGEGFDHLGESEDFWIVEIMGLPFGMNGELLSEVQNSQYRGLLFAATQRFMGIHIEPRYLWRFLRNYGIADMDFTGFWNEECPVRASDDRVKVSLYLNRAEGKGMIAYASFAGKDEGNITFSLLDDLGMRDMEMPEIELFQSGRTLVSNESFTVAPDGGGLITFRL